MFKPPESPWLRYGIAFGAVAWALAARWALSPLLGSRAPAVLFLLATILSAVFAGLVPSLMTLALGAFAAFGLFSVQRQGDPAIGLAISVALYLAVGLAISFYIEAARVTREQLEREVAERRRAEENTREHAERTRITLASIGDAVVVADAEGLVVSLNPRAEAMTGWRTSEAVNRPLKEVFRTVDAETMTTAEMPIAEVLRDGAILFGDGPTVMVARDGSTRHIENSTAPLRNDDGEIGGVVLVFRDITDRRKAEVELAEQTLVANSLQRVGSRLAAELDLGRIIQLVTEETVAITHATFGAFFYDDGDDEVHSAKRSALSLYASAGKLPSGFPPKRAASAVSAAFRGEQVVRIDDMAELPAPDPSNPPSWPGIHAMGRPAMRSLLAVPVVSRSGRVMGAFVVGSGEASAFGPIEERLSAGIAAQTAVAIDNARLYQAAQEAEQRFRQLAENVSDVFWMYESPSRRLLYCSPAYETTWGRSCQSLFEDSQTFVDSIHPDDRDRVLGVFAPRERGEPTGEEYRIIRPDGSIRWIWDRGFPIKDKSDNVVRVAGIAEDITERKASEEALRESDRRKTEFIAMLAHELRNPLAPIRNALDLIKNRAAIAEESAAFGDEHRMIERQVVHMTRLIDDLLDISRISRGKIPIRRQVVDLAQLVEQVIATIRPIADQFGHEVIVSLPPRESPVKLLADPTRLEQIFGNLLNNAVKYTDPGGKIGVTILVEGPFAAIRIRDTGIGIARELLPKVFDSFVQGLDRGARAQGGLGIGLSLVRSLVEIHGGTISAWSDGPGLGSEFIVRLPILPEPAIPQQPSPPVLAPSPTPPLSDDRPGRHRVLVVDDNHDAATSLVRLLTRVWGQEVRVAHDGPSAVEVAVEFRPELVLLDIGLPGMSGYDVAKTLRGRPEFDATRLVALTGWGQDEDRRKSTEAGFDRHMVKPIEPRVLGELVAGLDLGVLP